MLAGSPSSLTYTRMRRRQSCVPTHWIVHSRACRWVRREHRLSLFEVGRAHSQAGTHKRHGMARQVATNAPSSQPQRPGRAHAAPTLPYPAPPSITASCAAPARRTAQPRSPTQPPTLPLPQSHLWPRANPNSLPKPSPPFPTCGTCPGGRAPQRAAPQTGTRR